MIIKGSITRSKAGHYIASLHENGRRLWKSGKESNLYVARQLMDQKKKELLTQRTNRDSEGQL